MYMVWDLETENHETYKRFSNPFDDVNWVIARGWKIQGDKKCSWSYHKSKDGKFTHIPKNISLLVGHNIKFDLHFEWKNPELIAFIKRGGRIWDTQYAEYLINAQHDDSQMVSLDECSPRYGGTKKMNAVKALWDQGYLTSQIDEDMLIDYLVGTTEEGRNAGDIGNTEKIFLGQFKKAEKLGMLEMIAARMDGLLCTTEMEYNGLKIDVQEAIRKTRLLEARLEVVDGELEQYIPELPEELEFNWSSPLHASALIFGGAIKYKKKMPVMENGQVVCKVETKQVPLVGGNPDLGYLEHGLDFNHLIYDRYTSGKKKGDIKYAKIKVPGEPKMKFQDQIFEFPGYTAPDGKWQTERTDANGDPVYSVGANIIEDLGKRDIPFLKLLAERQSIVKDLGTYYLRHDGKKYTGMLTYVMKDNHILHHRLNHSLTVTTRLSSSDPNCQNIPDKNTSEVKKMFVSRFGKDGIMMEADYSQLEVIGQGLLSGDENLCTDIRNKVDFHCKRVAAKYKITYEEALKWCKDESHPDFKNGKDARRKAKEFSFQRAYGAGAAAIAEKTGMQIDEIKELIEAEEIMYPGVIRFNDSVEQAVKRTAVPFRDPTRGYRTYRRGWWQAPTGTRYTWRSNDAPKWMQDKGIKDSFKPTEIKNYPVQGTCAEIVQIIIGKLFRHFLIKNNYEGKALLCNQVHDSVWIDVHKDVVKQVAEDVKAIMESVPQVLNELYGMEVNVPFPTEIETGDNLYSKSVFVI
jgi:DNA polymerase-1